MRSPGQPKNYGPDWRGPRFLRQARQRRALLELTGQLADLIRLRVPLAEGISAMALDAPDAKVRTLLFVLSMDLKSGLPLHEALSRRSDFFPAGYVDIVRVGETTNQLDTSLDWLEGSLRQSVDFEEDLAGHLFYLKAILFAVLLVGTMAIATLTGQFREIFSSLGDTLPGTTQWLARIHQPLSAVSGWAVLCGILLLALVFSRLERWVSRITLGRGGFSRLLWRWLLCTPWIGRLYRARDLSHAAQQLEALTRAGLPLDKALEDAAAGNVSPPMAEALGRLSGAVRNGLSFDKALAREGTGRFPHTFRGLAQLGDQAGALPDALGQLAGMYRSEALHQARMLMNVGTPLGVCCVGAYVFIVCHSFYGTIFGLSSLVKP